MAEITKKTDLEFKNDDILLNGISIANKIRTIEVTNKVSTISKLRVLRKIINEKLKICADGDNIVIDGKDIGTVVFPDAQFKFFLVCDINTRAARRKQDFLDAGVNVPLDKVIKELQKRDELEFKRNDGPLKKAQDAVEIDTTNMIIEEQVDCLYKKIIASDIFK